VTTIVPMPDLSNREEMQCPDCKKPLFVSTPTPNHAVFDACGNDCRLVYDVPEDAILFGPKEGRKTIWIPKGSNPNLPLKCIPRYRGHAW